MMKLLRKIKISKSGASAAEYALILAVVGGGIATAAILLGTNISTSISNTAAKVANPA